MACVITYRLYKGPKKITNAETSNIDLQEVAKFSKLAGQWWERNGACSPLHVLNPIRMRFIQQHVLLADKRVLDVGCGAGILTESLAEAGALVTAIDPSQELIAAAQTHAISKQLKIQYVATTIEDFSTTKPQQFDAVMCMELIEHVPDPVKLISDCASLLKPGGHLFLATINRTPKAYVLAILAAENLLKILPKHTHDYKKLLRPAELAGMLQSCSLQVMDLRGVKYQPFSKSAEFCNDLSINYLAYAKREADGDII